MRVCDTSRRWAPSVTLSRVGDSRESARSPGLARKLVVSLVPTFLILGGAELYFRLHPHQEVFETNLGFAEADPDLIWRLKPHASGPLATNQLGLRDPTYDPDADFTILLLGDSVSWGNGVDDPREVFPFLLERALDGRHPTRSIEVINSGVPGYSTFQEQRYLELHGDDLDPDLVILQTCLNDAVERYWLLAEYGGNNEFMGSIPDAPSAGSTGSSWVTPARSRAWRAGSRRPHAPENATPCGTWPATRSNRVWNEPGTG